MPGGAFSSSMLSACWTWSAVSASRPVRLPEGWLGFRQEPGHKGEVLSPRGNLNVGAVGGEPDDDRLVAQPLHSPSCA